MKRSISVTLGMGTGWILGVTVMMIIMPLNGALSMGFIEAIISTLFYGFPGFVLFMIALILSVKNNSSNERFDSSF